MLISLEYYLADSNIQHHNYYFFARSKLFSCLYDFLLIRSYGQIINHVFLFVPLDSVYGLSSFTRMKEDLLFSITRANIKKGRAMTRAITSGSLVELGMTNLAKSTSLFDASWAWNNILDVIINCKSLWSAKKKLRNLCQLFQFKKT